MKSNVYVYLIDSFADWEIGFLTAELKSRRYFKKNVPEVNVITVGNSSNQVTSMGGMKVQCDITIEELKVRMNNADSKNDMLVLPGSNAWLEQNKEVILGLASQWFCSGRNLTAICGATIALACIGLLDNIKHTSNNKGFLMQICPSYKGEALYQNEPSVSEQNLITASGIAPLDFAFKVIEKLDVFADDTIMAWYNLYKTQDSNFFYDLMSSMEKK